MKDCDLDAVNAMLPYPNPNAKDNDRGVSVQDCVFALSIIGHGPVHERCEDSHDDLDK